MNAHAICTLGELAEDTRRRADPVELSGKRAAAGRLGAAARARTMDARLGPKPEGPLCSSCKRRSPKPGRKCCPTCIGRSSKSVTRRRAEAREEGLCLCGNDLVEDRTACADCLEDARGRVEESRARRSAAA